MPAEGAAAPPEAAAASAEAEAGAALAPSVENARSPLAQSASAPHDAPRVADGTSSTLAAFQEEAARALRASREELETPTNCGEGAAREEGGGAAAEPLEEAPFSAEPAGALRQTTRAPPLGVLDQQSDAISAAGTSTEVPGPPPAPAPLGPPALRQTTPEGVQRRTPSVCWFFFFFFFFFFEVEMSTTANDGIVDEMRAPFVLCLLLFLFFSFARRERDRGLRS